MPKKKTVQRCTQEFRRDARKLIKFCSAAEGRLSDAHVSVVYDGAVINLYAAFQRMMIGTLTGAINNDTTQLSATTSVQFPGHLTDEVCEYIVIGRGYFNFRGRDELIGEIRKYILGDHYLAQAVKEPQYKTSLDRLCALRNHAAHNSKPSKMNALKSIDQKRMGSAGSWLKRQSRFSEMVLGPVKLSKEIAEGARY